MGRVERAICSRSAGTLGFNRKLSEAPELGWRNVQIMLTIIF